MTDFVALLRGVNVGGISIKMAELAETVRALGYDDVKTVLASGNVLFSTGESASTAKERLESALSARFAYEAWVHVLPVSTVSRIIDDYPFERGRDGWHDYVVVVVDGDSRVALEEVIPELDPEVEIAAIGSGVLYWSVERGHTLDSAFGKAQAKVKHKRWVTTRNVNTLDKLIPRV